MSLQKGFLKPIFDTNTLSRKRFWSGLVVGLLSAIVFYTCLCVGRESIRFIAGKGGIMTTINQIVLLTEHERLFFNFFFAFLGLIWGQGLCITIWLGVFRQRSHIVGEITYQSQAIFWGFISLIAVASFSFGLQLLPYIYYYEEVIDLYQDFYYSILLALTVLFLYSWQIIRRFFRVRFHQVGKLFGIFVLISFCFISINWGTHDQLTNIFFQSNPSVNYKIKLPQTSYHQSLSSKQSLNTFIYMGYAKSNTSQLGEPKIIIDDYPEISLSELAGVLNRKKYFDEKLVPQIFYCLLIDMEMPMKYVKQVQMEMRSVMALKVAYIVRKKVNWNTLLSGILVLLPPLSEEDFQANLENYPHLQKYPPPPPPPIIDTLNNPTLQLRINAEGQLLVNKKVVEEGNLKNSLQVFLEEYPIEGIVVLKVSEDATYNEYIQLQGILKESYQTIRNKEAMNQYGQLYEDLEREQKKEIRLLHPMRLREFW